jgi:hypothetical protein
MKRWKKIMSGLLVLGLYFIPISMVSAENLEKDVRFLKEVDAVSWYKVDGKDIIIGWKGLPDTFYGWNHRTAVKASLASLYEVNVWSVRHRQKNWLPGRGGHICVTTAKYGRFKKSNCTK